MANPEHLEILKQGVEVWNRWREENPDIRPNLRGEDLSGANLNEADLRRVNLCEAGLSKASLCNAILNWANLNEAELSWANLNKAILYEASLVETGLIKANLSETHLIKANLSKAKLFSANLTKANLRGANLFGASLNRAILIETSFIKANLEDADLNDADLSKANLSGAIFVEADLTRADLSEAILSYTVFSGVYLGEAKSLDSIKSFGPSYIDIHTLYYSQGKIPEIFLQKAGVPDELIDYLDKIKTPECSYTLEQLDQWITSNQELALTLNRRIAHLEKQKAGYGPLNVPFHTVEDIENAKTQLEDVTAEIAKWKRLKDIYY